VRSATTSRADLKEFNGEDDHVHLLVHYPPKVQLSKLVNSLKGVSSRRLRQEHDAHVARSTSQMAFPPA
jgi:putative transposase